VQFCLATASGQVRLNPPLDPMQVQEVVADLGKAANLVVLTVYGAFEEL
jgi:hypothetical protein